MFKYHRSLYRLKNLLPHLVDPKVGLIHSVQEEPKEAGYSNFFRFIAKIGNTTAWLPQENFFVGAGAATNREMAMVKAIGEAIERYCPAIYEKTDFSFISYAEADFCCVHPSKFTLFSSQQYQSPEFSFKPFTEKSLVRWTKVKNLRTHQVTHIPACYVYIPYLFDQQENEVPIARLTSSGLCCHCSYEEAVIGGICEVIERDCFSITWQAMLSCPRIRNASLSKTNQNLVKCFEKVGYQINLINITSDNGIPTVLSVARHSQKDAAPLATAISTALNPEEAIKKSLEELAHVERNIIQIKKQRPRIPLVAQHKNVRGQLSHINFWCSPERTIHADFLTNSKKEINFSDLPNIATDDPVKDLQILVQRIAETGQDVLVTDITTEDVREMGLWVIRAVIPGYHPLFMGYNNRALGGKRLWELPQKRGYLGINPQKGDNPFPHPL